MVYLSSKRLVLSEQRTIYTQNLSWKNLLVDRQSDMGKIDGIQETSDLFFPFHFSQNLNNRRSATDCHGNQYEP